MSAHVRRGYSSCRRRSDASRWRSWSGDTLPYGGSGTPPRESNVANIKVLEVWCIKARHIPAKDFSEIRPRSDAQLSSEARPISTYFPASGIYVRAVGGIMSSLNYQTELETYRNLWHCAGSRCSE